MKKDYLYVAVLGWKPGLQVIDDVWFKLAGKPSEEIHGLRQLHLDYLKLVLVMKCSFH